MLEPREMPVGIEDQVVVRAPIADPGGDVTVTDYSWSVEGGSYGSSTSQEWEVGEIRPEPAHSADLLLIQSMKTREASNLWSSWVD